MSDQSTSVVRVDQDLVETRCDDCGAPHVITADSARRSRSHCCKKCRIRRAVKTRLMRANERLASGDSRVYALAQQAYPCLFPCTPLVERVLLRMAPDSSSGLLTPCWSSLKAVSGKGADAAGGGYGVTVVNGKSRSKHVILYEYFIGTTPEGMELDHLCRRRSCGNPAHLEPVTHRENCLRGVRKTRITHCPAGHPYSGDNLYIKPNGKRTCRTCRRNQKRDARAKLGK